MQGHGNPFLSSNPFDDPEADVQVTVQLSPASYGNRAGQRSSILTALSTNALLKPMKVQGSNNPPDSSPKLPRYSYRARQAGYNPFNDNSDQDHSMVEQVHNINVVNNKLYVHTAVENDLQEQKKRIADEKRREREAQVTDKQRSKV
jgi:hypothetical protein